MPRKLPRRDNTVCGNAYPEPSYAKSYNPRSSIVYSSWCHGACSRASWCRAGPSSATGPAGYDREPGFGFFSSLVERKHDGVGRRLDIEPDHVAQFVDEVRIVRELELPITVRLKPVRLPDAPDRAGADLPGPRSSGPTRSSMLIVRVRRCSFIAEPRAGKVRRRRRHIW
jgi:hypothetical protein